MKVSGGWLERRVPQEALRIPLWERWYHWRGTRARSQLPLTQALFELEIFPYTAVSVRRFQRGKERQQASLHPISYYCWRFVRLVFWILAALVVALIVDAAVFGLASFGLWLITGSTSYFLSHALVFLVFGILMMLPTIVVGLLYEFFGGGEWCRIKLDEYSLIEDYIPGPFEEIVNRLEALCPQAYFGVDYFDGGYCYGSDAFLVVANGYFGRRYYIEHWHP